MMRRINASAIGLILSFLAGCASSAPIQPILATVPLGTMERQAGLPVLHLYGSAYDMGYQHGSLLRPQVQASVKNAMAFAYRQFRIPGVGRWIVRRKLDRTWKEMKPFIPEQYLDELEGLADGARIPRKDLQRIHAIPELASVSCSSFAAAGSATQDGQLIQMRNLDWAIQSDVQRYAALLVYHPAGKRPFVSIGWLGFIGVITGVSQEGISVAEIGAESAATSLKGIPMPFLLRRVLEESEDLNQAVKIVETAPRTVGYNYLFADAKRKEAVALETNQKRCAVFWMGEVSPASAFAIDVKDTLFRSDFSLDPDVRNLQRACRGEPEKPGLESPIGSKAYEARYQGQGQLLRQFHGRLDPEVAMAIARAIAPASNIQSVVWAFPDLWIATARGRRPAAEGVYQRVNLRELFGR